MEVNKSIVENFLKVILNQKKIIPTVNNDAESIEIGRISIRCQEAESWSLEFYSLFSCLFKGPQLNSWLSNWKFSSAQSIQREKLCQVSRWKFAKTLAKSWKFLLFHLQKDQNQPLL